MAHLVAIINFWDGGELLPYAVDNWWKCGVDDVIIVYTNTSNYGHTLAGLDNTNFLKNPAFKKCKTFLFDGEGYTAAQKETSKRNHGLTRARELGATHFVTADCDEFYDPDEFKHEFKRIKDSNGEVWGLCCASRVYFKRPTLTIGRDITTVPFIHVMLPGMYHGMNRHYPYAFVDGAIRIDPTRQLNLTRGVEWSNIMMEHYSWCRKDINQKIMNSTARGNIEKSDVREEFKVAEAGYFLKFYGRTLYTVENKFNLPDYGGTNMGQDVSHGGQPPSSTDPVAKH